MISDHDPSLTSADKAPLLNKIHKKNQDMKESENIEETMLECANELHEVKETLAQEVDVNAALAPAGSIARQGTLIRPQCTDLPVHPAYWLSSIYEPCR